MTPRKGAIAYCSIGLLGVINSEEPKEITYEDGNTGVAWTGQQLTNAFSENHPNGPHRKTVGGPWSSRTPEVIGYVDPDKVEALVESLKSPDEAEPAS